MTTGRINQVTVASRAVHENNRPSTWKQTGRVATIRSLLSYNVSIGRRRVIESRGCFKRRTFVDIRFAFRSSVTETECAKRSGSYRCYPHATTGFRTCALFAEAYRIANSRTRHDHGQATATDCRQHDNTQTKPAE